MYKICFYVPENAMELVKQAMFDAGAGRVGDYDSCCWQTKGAGQFRPLDNSNPHIGQHGKLETVSEYKIEMICDEKNIRQAIDALKQSHPYEEPAYDVWRLEDF